jgi:tRNA(adenine34) deaminase
MNHEYFMRQALAEARSALAAGEFPVGCILVHQGRIITVGRRMNSRAEAANELDHAEAGAVRRLIANHPELNPAEVTAYCTMEPCLMCYATMLLNGIRTFVYGYEDAMGGGTDLQLHQLKPLYREMKVSVVPHILRAESLALFKEFFTKPANDYWQGSLLAEYTLRQS